MEASAGIRFGNYQLIKRLAHGGMAEVFLARQRGLQGFDRRVAIKRILPHLADSEDFLRMFLEEARLVASLSHPNVVHIYELGRVDEHYFLAMEHIDGVHAGDIIDRGPAHRMPAALVARIGADACTGLNYVHHAVDAEGQPLRLVHRDISPPNLMISYDGVVKLMDFGIAKAAGQMDLTRPGVVKGKFAYMSPEQTMGQQLDGRSDVFSLCLILWEMLAGEVALSRADPVMAMMMIRDGKLRPIRSVRPDVPQALADVLQRGLEVDRVRRATAAELGHELERFIKSSPELGTSMQLSTWVRQGFPRVISAGDSEDLDPESWGVGASTMPDQDVLRESSRDSGQPAGTPSRLPDEVVASRPPTTLSETSLGAEPPKPSRSSIYPLARDAGVPATGAPEAGQISARTLRRLRVGAGILAGLSLASVLALLLSPDRAPAGRAGRAVDAGPAAALVPADAAGALEAQAPQEPGRLIVVTAPPGAQVLLDGRAPQTAPARFVDLAPGVYEVTIRRDGYESVTRSVAVRPGRAEDLIVSLPPATSP